MAEPMEDLGAEAKALARDVYRGHGVEGLAMFLSGLAGEALTCSHEDPLEDLLRLRVLLSSQWLRGEIDCNTCGRVHAVGGACP